MFVIYYSSKKKKLKNTSTVTNFLNSYFIFIYTNICKNLTNIYV